MNQSFTMQISQRFQSRCKHIARFRWCQRPLRKKLREVFSCIFHYYVKQIEIANAAASALKKPEHMRMRELRGSLPARKLELGRCSLHLNKFYGCFLRR